VEREERLLGQILGLLPAADQGIEDAKDVAVVAQKQQVERLLVFLAPSLQQQFIRLRRLGHPGFRSVRMTRARAFIH